MHYSQAKKIMGRNFIGPEELSQIADALHISGNFIGHRVPAVPFNEKTLEKISKDFILVLGIPKDENGDKLTIDKLRSFLGVDPKINEPCFYNQDWYLKESFANKNTLSFKWYIISRRISSTSRGRNPDLIAKKLLKNEKFPSAILTVFTFFAYYFYYNQILWKNDFLWCSDRDHNGDVIYTGRYVDPKGINKNGFNIHRHLKIQKTYGMAQEIVVK